MSDRAFSVLSEMMHHSKIDVLDPYHADAVSLLQTFKNITIVLPTDARRNDWHMDADAILLRSDTQIRLGDFSKAKSLRLIVQQGVGVDDIDLEAAKAANIAVHNTPAINSETVAELCLALALSLSRRVCEIDRKLRNGEKLV
jgi:D-3-phosphoglycerate dehydrogenase